ncbi:MAG: DoxX family protein [Flavobacteriales bacterium]
MVTILKYILTIAFTLAGGAKVFRAKPMVEQFKEFGLPSFAVSLVGALEVLGAIGLWFPRFTGFMAIGLLLLMIGAIINHLKAKHPFKKNIPAMLLGILAFIYIILIFKQ